MSRLKAKRNRLVLVSSMIWLIEPEFSLLARMLKTFVLNVSYDNVTEIDKYIYIYI